MTDEQQLNGVDTAIVAEAVRAIGQDPEVASFRFHLHNEWAGGGQNRSATDGFYGAKQEQRHSRTFEWQSDEPPALAGRDAAPNPVEHLLNALAACLTSTLVYHAALRGIKIERLESDIEGDLDLRGFLGLSDDVRRGYENIRVNFRVRTDAENIERLKALSRLSPVYDVTSRGTNVDVRIERI